MTWQPTEYQLQHIHRPRQRRKFLESHLDASLRPVEKRHAPGVNEHVASHEGQKLKRRRQRRVPPPAEGGELGARNDGGVGAGRGAWKWKGGMKGAQHDAGVSGHSRGMYPWVDRLAKVVVH